MSAVPSPGKQTTPSPSSSDEAQKDPIQPTKASAEVNGVPGVQDRSEAKPTAMETSPNPTTSKASDPGPETKAKKDEGQPRADIGEPQVVAADLVTFIDPR